MNRLKTDINGGMPLELDDIRWQEEAVRDAFYGFLSAFGILPRESFRLSGCIVTINGTTYTTTAGYICLSGEVLKVDAHSITVPAYQTAKWIVVTEFDASGLETFEDNTVNDTYEIRKAQLAVTAAVFPATYMQYSRPYLADLIVSLANDCEGWHEVDALDEPVFSSGWSNKGGSDATVAFRIDNNNVVHLKGVATSLGTQGEIFTLPTGYRPSLNRSFYLNYPGADPVSLTIASDGLVWVNTLGSTDVALDLCFAL